MKLIIVLAAIAIAGCSEPVYASVGTAPTTTIECTTGVINELGGCEPVGSEPDPETGLPVVDCAPDPCPIEATVPPATEPATALSPDEGSVMLPETGDESTWILLSAMVLLLVGAAILKLSERKR